MEPQPPTESPRQDSTEASKVFLARWTESLRWPPQTLIKVQAVATAGTVLVGGLALASGRPDVALAMGILAAGNGINAVINVFKHGIHRGRVSN